jgi:hypothetical protein
LGRADQYVSKKLRVSFVVTIESTLHLGSLALAAQVAIVARLAVGTMLGPAEVAIVGHFALAVVADHRLHSHGCAAIFSTALAMSLVLLHVDITQIVSTDSQTNVNSAPSFFTPSPSRHRP